jgi:hypothetical protein
MVFKSALQETVRMETPVLYFYSPRPLTASVHVTFLRGRLTEWYPNALMKTPAALDWPSLSVAPAEGALPHDSGPSHYYAARNTDALAVESEGEREKMLFYRGAGSFDIPVQPAVTAAGVSVRVGGPAPLPLVAVFENRHGKIGYRALRDVSGTDSVQFEQLAGDRIDFRNDLEAALIRAGLYPLEASAMLDTWRDSWFEEEVRVFYILPQPSVDKILPLAVSPQPAQTVRAFVGRVEMLAPWMREEIVAALRQGDTGVMDKYGRFLDSFLQQIGNTPRAAAADVWLEARRSAVKGQIAPKPCPQ